MVVGTEVMSNWAGLDVYLPNGRKLGVVYDAVIDADGLQCTHLFVRETPEDLVEGSIPLAVPWRWIRAIDEIVLLRWFPPTPIPIQS
ncbi:MAG: PRC-barrel domain-containing protein [Poseidonia sp.]|jgi:sporulation protein YlmC with PRC-barrel domain